MKTKDKKELRLFLHSGWWWAFMVCGALVASTILSLFLPAPLNGLSFWVRVAEWFYGDLDAPDNWALGITCCMKSMSVLAALAFVMGLIAVLKIRKKMKLNETTSA